MSVLGKLVNHTLCAWSIINIYRIRPPTVPVSCLSHSTCRSLWLVRKQGACHSRGSPERSSRLWLVQPSHPCQLGSEPADVRPLISSTTLPFKYNKFSKKVPQTPLKKYGTITTSASILLGNADLQILNATENHLETLPWFRKQNIYKITMYIFSYFMNFNQLTTEKSKLNSSDLHFPKYKVQHRWFQGSIDI